MDKNDCASFDLLKHMRHQPPMLLADKILCEEANKGSTIFKVKKDCIFLQENGFLSRSAFIEIAAQSLAAVDAFQKLRDGKEPLECFLAAVKDFEFFEDAKEGDEILCDVEKVDEFERLHMAKAVLKKLDEQTVFAKGEIRIYELP
jgi:predicted hotdog family 3-hydroxylacyl-ACP dehydratase